MEKTYSLFVIFIVQCCNLFGQDFTIADSLRQAIQNSSSDVDKYESLHLLAIEYLDRDNKKALDVVLDAEVVALRIDDSLYRTKSQRLKAQVLYRLGMVQETIETITQALPYATANNYHEEHLAMVNLLGGCYLSLSQFDNALRYHLMTLDIARKIGDKGFEAAGLMNIGLCYYKLKDYSKALPFMLEGYRMSDSLGVALFIDPMNISLCFSYLKDFDSARKYLAKSLDHCGPACSPFAKLHIFYTSGCIWFGAGDAVRAEDNFLASLTLAEELGDDRMYLDNICMLTEIQVRQGDWEEAGRYLKKAEGMIDAGIPFNLERIKVYAQLGNLYLKLEDYKRATYFQSLYISLRDSIYDEAVTTSLMKIEADHRNQQNQIKIASQKAIILDKDQLIRTQTFMNVIAGILSAATMASLIFLFRIYKRKRDLNALLEQRVRLRTADLENEVGALVKLLKERELEMSKIKSAVSQTVGTMKGISKVLSLALTDHERNLCLARLNDEIARLSRTRNRSPHIEEEQQ